MTQPTDTASVVTATIVETYRWINYADILGIVFDRDGTLLGGIISIDKSDPKKSFEQDWKRYSTSLATISYDATKVDAKGNKIIDHVSWGPFSDLSKEEAWAAVEKALEATKV